MRTPKYLIIITLSIALTTFCVESASALLTGWTVEGNAYVNGNSAVLTANSNNQIGAAWKNGTIDLNNDFSLTAIVYLGSNTNGADGISFVLQNTAAGYNELGLTGGEWTGTNGIYPAIAVEIDTYRNVPRGDLVCDHLGVNEYPSNGSGLPNHSGAGPTCAVPAGTNIKDGLEHSFTVNWVASTHTMTVYFDGVLRITYTKDVVSTIFGGQHSVYYGYTGSTGGAKNYQYATPLNMTTDVSVTKTVNNAAPSENDNITYTISATNLGPNDATGMYITDNLPAGLTYVSSTVSKGTFTSGTGVWNIGTIINGHTETLTITAKVNSGTGGTAITNTAAITASNLDDSNTANDSGSVTINVIAANISVAKTVDLSTIPESASVTYTITITNSALGDGWLTNIVDTLPAGFTYVTGTTTGLTTANPAIAGQQLTWSGGWIVPRKVGGTNGSLTLSFKATGGSAAGTFYNNTTVNGTGISPVSTGNTAPVTVQTPSILTTKQASYLASTPGSVVTFSVYYHNTGTGSASNVVITDTIPANMTYVPNSLKMGSASSSYTTATPKTDAVDGDEGQFTSPNIIFKLNSVAADDGVANSGPDEGIVYFKAVIN